METRKPVRWGRRILLIVALALLIVLFESCFFVVRQNEYGIVRQFGAVVDVKDEPGLYFKVPFIQQTGALPNTVLLYDLPVSDLLTADTTSLIDSAALINAQERKEKAVKAKADLMAKNELTDFNCAYLMKVLCSIDDDDVRQLATDMATDNLPQLSKIHTQYAVIVEERDKLISIVPERIYNWKNALLVMRINEVKAQIAHATPEQLPQLMEHLQELYDVRHKLAAFIGDRVVNPN